MGRLIAAIRFLTIIPVPGRVGTGEINMAGSLPFFPIIGLLIGMIAVGLSHGLWFLFPPLPAAVLMVIFLAAVSGGLHMDGFCDTADGFFSSRPRERILEIMRDSRVGAMGVMAIVFIVVLKVAALELHDVKNIGAVVLLMPLAGRCALLVQMAILPYARPAGGLATLFYTRSSKLSALWGAGLLLGIGAIAAGAAGFAAAGISLAVIFLFAGYCRLKIGGATGDTLGAGCELAETVVALVFAARPVLELL